LVVPLHESLTAKKKTKGRQKTDPLKIAWLFLRLLAPWAGLLQSCFCEEIVYSTRSQD
jgi:hypothetical protein